MIRPDLIDRARDLSIEANRERRYHLFQAAACELEGLQAAAEVHKAAAEREALIARTMDEVVASRLAVGL